MILKPVLTVLGVVILITPIKLGMTTGGKVYEHCNTNTESIKADKFLGQISYCSV